MNNHKRFSVRIHSFSLLALLMLVGAAPASPGASFTATGVLGMVPNSMSDDAAIVVGTCFFGIPNYYYTEAGGVVVIGDGCGGPLSISGDGTTVVGCEIDGNGNQNAAKWLGGTSWRNLGSEAGAVPCDTLLSQPYGVNQNGSLAVGLLWRVMQCHANGGTWDLVNGGPATVLPTLFDGPATRANAVNADGSVIVGWQDQPTGQRTAAKWVNSVPELILTSDGAFNGEALAVSADGGTIVGYGYNFGQDAWIWRARTGVTPIGMSARIMGEFFAVDVSDDGKVVVGFIRKGLFNQTAFIWRYGRGAAYLDQFIKKHGAVIPDGWNLNVASIISPDGNTIYGWGFNPGGQVEMFKVALNAPTAGPQR